jgi:hypothetical protein
VLLALARSGTEATRHKFTSLRVMDFITHQIDLEYEVGLRALWVRGTVWGLGVGVDLELGVGVVLGVGGWGCCSST